jgi:hypothetical protein
MYCVGENDIDLTSFYIENAERFLAKYELSAAQPNTTTEFLRWLINATNCTMMTDDDMDRYLSLLITSEQLLRPEARLSDQEVNHLTTSNQLFKIFLPSHTVKTLALSILLLGLGLQRAIRANYRTSDLYSFAQALAIHCTSDTFRYLPPIVAVPLALAANTVINCIDSLNNEAVNNMQKLKNGLEELSAKFPIVKARYEVTIARLAHTISAQKAHDVTSTSDFNRIDLEKILCDLLDQGSNSATYDMSWLNDIDDDFI